MAGSGEQRVNQDPERPPAGDDTSKMGKSRASALNALKEICSVVIFCMPLIVLVFLYLLFSILFADDINTFLISSFIGVFLDPLFLYIPLVDENKKCLLMDHGLKKVALVLRTITDLRYILRIFRTIKGGIKEPSMIKRIVMSLAIDIIAVLPIPQVVILIFLPNMRGTKSFHTMKILNALIVLQYLARIFPIYRFCMQLNKIKLGERSKPDVPNVPNIEKKKLAEQYADKILSFPGKVPKLWVPAIVNFIMYIIASHVFGAFWYFFSIQREMDCWGHACRIQSGCEFTSHCGSNKFKNLTLITNVCPVNPPDDKVFNFGIFAYPLQFGMQESTDLSQKLLICFSWGLRNLSSFASNLTGASTYGWENLFVIAISLSGLLLFIYLLGHLQTFMQETNRSERLRQKMKIIIEPKIESMLPEYGLTNKQHESTIKNMVKKKLEENEDLVVENMFSILSLYPSDDYWVCEFKHTLFVDKLQKLPMFKKKSTSGLMKICERLEPKVYAEGDYIIKQGEPLDMMFFITQGIALIYETNKIRSSITQHEKEDGGLHGKELLNWAGKSPSKLSDLPMSHVTVKVHKKVEVFAIKAADLPNLIANLPDKFCTVL